MTPCEDLEGFVLEVLPHEGDEIESLERVGLGPEAFEQNVTRRGDPRSTLGR